MATPAAKRAVAERRMEEYMFEVEEVLKVL